jgi:hypothetical protein
MINRSLIKLKLRIPGFKQRGDITFRHADEILAMQFRHAGYQQ